MAGATIAVIAAIWATIGWLLSTTHQVPARDTQATGADQAQVRVEVVRTGLAAGGGVGAAAGLMLGFRRQRHQEFAANEGRVTTFYTTAAEQLGSDKAPVRLAALYTLERLANDNPQHRQTIVNIICAYLRISFTPPDQAAQRPRADTIRDRHRTYKAAKAGRTATSAVPTADAREEHEVRLTAQRILTDHLKKAPTSTGHRFWKNIDLDLTGATLTDLDLGRCTIHTARFAHATFTGEAVFRGATLTGHASFENTTFSGRASFEHTTFVKDASFRGATFTGNASFDGATFTGSAAFDGTTFDQGVSWPTGWTP